MAHNIRGFSAPVSNSNIVGLYGEVRLTTVNVEKLISPLDLDKPNYPSDSGESVQLQSDDANDTAVTILVKGLDANFVELVEAVELNGTTPVQTTKAFARINFLSNISETPHVGFVTVTNLLGDVDYRSCSPEAQVSLDSFYTIPKDRKFYVDSAYAAITRDANGQAINTVSIYYKPFEMATRRSFKFSQSATGNSSVYYPNDIPSELPGGAEIYLTAFASDATGDKPTEVVQRLTLGLR